MYIFNELTKNDMQTINNLLIVKNSFVPLITQAWICYIQYMFQILIECYDQYIYTKIILMKSFKS